MGSIMDRVLSSMKMLPEDIDLEEYEDEDDFDEEERENTRPVTRKTAARNEEEDAEEDKEEKKGFFRKKGYDNDAENEPARILSVEPTRKATRSVRNLPATVQGTKQSEVKMITPLTYDEAKDIVDLLIEGKTVVLNLERIKVDLGQRIIDFTAGACFTMGGDMQSISRKIFIATPSNVELSGDFTNILTGNGSMDFSMLNLNA